MTGMLASAFGSAGSYILSTQCSVVSQTQYSTIISPTSHPLCLTPTDPACFLCLQVVSVAPFGFAPLALHSSKFALGPGFSFICTARTPPFSLYSTFPCSPLSPNAVCVPSSALQAPSVVHADPEETRVLGQVESGNAGRPGRACRAPVSV